MSEYLAPQRCVHSERPFYERENLYVCQDPSCERYGKECQVKGCEAFKVITLDELITQYERQLREVRNLINEHHIIGAKMLDKPEVLEALKSDDVQEFIDLETYLYELYGSRSIIQSFIFWMKRIRDGAVCINKEGK